LAIYTLSKKSQQKELQKVLVAVKQYFPSKWCKTFNRHYHGCICLNDLMTILYTLTVRMDNGEGKLISYAKLCYT